MNISDYIKEIRESITDAGITDVTQSHEVLMLSIFKLLQSPAIMENFEKCKLEHINKVDETLRIKKSGLFSENFIIKPDNSITVLDKDFGHEARSAIELKSSGVKNIELKMVDILKNSHSFADYHGKFNTLIEVNDENDEEIKKEKRDFTIYSKIDKTLIHASKMLNDLKNEELAYINSAVDPFGVISSNHVEPLFIKLVAKNISDKLDYLESEETLFQTISSVDGIDYTSFKKFKEAFYNNELDEDSLFSKLLSSDVPTVCLEAIFEGEWFDTYKEMTLRSLKKCLLDPTLNDLYELYPIVDTIVDNIQTKYPYFNVNQNDIIQFKTVIELEETTDSEIVQNKIDFLEDVNMFRLDLKESDDNRLALNGKYTRVYGTSPFGVLIDVGGRHNYPANKDFSTIYLEKIRLDTIINDENEMMCVNRFMKLCEDNKIICIYDSENISEHAINVIKSYSGRVVSFDRNPSDSGIDLLHPYKLMIKDLNFKYSEILAVEKDIRSIPSGSSDDDMKNFLKSKLKSQPKLTP